MFDLLFKEYELNVMKADNILETAFDMFNTNLIENYNLIQEGYIDGEEDIYEIYHESSSTIKEKVKEFYIKIKEAFSSLLVSIRNAIKAQLVKRDAKKKLADINKKFVEDKKLAQMANGKTVTYFDTVKYSRMYTKYINTVVSGYSKLCSKKYNNINEYQKELKIFLNKIDTMEKQLKLDSEEKWKTKITLGNLIKKADFEIKTYDTIMSDFNKLMNDSMNKMNDLANKEDDTSKIQDTKNLSSKISSKLSSAVKKIAKSPIACVSIVIGEFVLLSKANKKIKNIAYNRALDKGYVAGMEDVKKRFGNKLK